MYINILLLFSQYLLKKLGIIRKVLKLRKILILFVIPTVAEGSPNSKHSI